MFLLTHGQGTERDCTLSAVLSGFPNHVGGVPELIRDEETGLLFDPLNQDSIASAMRQLSASDTSAMAARALKEAYQRFHPEIIEARHLEVYREVLSSRGV